MFWPSILICTFWFWRLDFSIGDYGILFLDHTGQDKSHYKSLFFFPQKIWIFPVILQKVLGKILFSLFLVYYWDFSVPFGHIFFLFGSLVKINSSFSNHVQFCSLLNGQTTNIYHFSKFSPYFDQLLKVLAGQIFCLKHFPWHLEIT
jgi:hypothetical protein